MEGEFNKLLALKDINNENYNKVMFYKVTHSVHGGTLPMSGFGKTINIAWGYKNENGTGEKIFRSDAPISSEKPPEDAGEVKYSINNTSWDIFLATAEGEGLKLRFVTNLMRVRIKKKYKNFDDVRRRMMTEHDSNISNKVVEEQLDILEKILDEDLNYTPPKKKK